MEKLEQLREAGFRLYAAGVAYRRRGPLAWYQACSPAEFRTSEVLLQALTRRTLFVSHRWDSTGTWNGADSWQLREVFDFMASSKGGGDQLDFFWMDGLCVPQEKDTNPVHGFTLASLTMLVISHLPTLIRRCGQFIVIDGARQDLAAVDDREEWDKYLNRAWCQYELWLGRHLKPSQPGAAHDANGQILEVSIDHEFVHRLFTSSALEVQDKILILRTIFYSAPAVLPGITYRPMVRVAEALMRAVLLPLRSRRFRAAPASKIVALNLITTHLR
eukprot:CAMPEP_0206413912 /NCGR_PEP_ID=MMETSP0294-20121207/35014_1 /ASSEMBLY_ACC=CAM_ASM_000327 /TAXON_ID=39354 /ORGANISM="Heterosigma akashiwo, Strain CCMP2393" /LENGTH=274 /DNA_ID=CAMNT_0053875627 /DNA_START=304 /DNA_END=1124 /DNA_ORIENTATION=-